jgi:hypothetical protein
MPTLGVRIPSNSATQQLSKPNQGEQPIYPAAQDRSAPRSVCRRVQRTRTPDGALVAAALRLVAPLLTGRRGRTRRRALRAARGGRHTCTADPAGARRAAHARREDGAKEAARKHAVIELALARNEAALEAYRSFQTMEGGAYKDSVRLCYYSLIDKKVPTNQIEAVVAESVGMNL